MSKTNRTSDIYTAIKSHLIQHDMEILDRASHLHKVYLSEKNYRLHALDKYQKNHQRVLHSLANNLERKDLNRGAKMFQKLGDKLARDSVRDKLYIEEAVNGMIFLKQAIWDILQEAGLLELPSDDFYYFSKTTATFCDVVASSIAFTYHNQYSKKIESEHTSREEAENFLHSEKKYSEDIVETIREPLLVLDKGLRVVSVNSAFNKTFKVSKRETLGKPVYKLGNGQWNIPQLRQLLESILPQKSQIQGFEVEHNFEKIGKKIMRLNAKKIEPVQLILLVVEDITDQIYQERELKSSQEKYRILVEGVKDYAIFIIESDGRIATWNRGAQRILGYNAKEVIGKNFEIFRTNEDDRKNAIEELEQVKRVGQYHEIGLRNRKDGSYFWADVLTTKIFHNAQQRGFAKIIRDISKQKTNEENLKFLSEASRMLSSTLDYKLTLDNIGKLAVPKIADWFAIDMLSDKGELQQVTLTHKDPAKIQWAREYRASNPPDMNRSTGVPQVIKTGKPVLFPHITKEMLKKFSKTEKEYKLALSIGITSAMIVPLFRSKKPIGAISLITTESKRNFNKKDLAMAQELSNRASVALENAKLYKLSQDAVSLRDTFISVASHELKTPVTSVKLFTQVLRKHSEVIGDAKAVDYLTKMENQLDKLTELIYDLLNVAKIQAGRMTFRKETFDFDTAVMEVISILQESITKHRLIVNGQTQTQITGDKERIGQVINNLISNAVKYSPKSNSINIELSKNNNDVILSVQDFGVGIHKSHLHKIFDRFYRVYSPTDKTYPGLGLGLYISAEIIKRHDGKLWVESTPKKGSIFTFSLPIHGTNSKD